MAKKRQTYATGDADFVLGQLEKSAKRKRKEKIEWKIATFDFETDPGEPPVYDASGKILIEGKTIKPFAWGFYDGCIYVSWNKENCVEKFVEYIKEIEEPHYIYAHNGGNFDFLFLLPYIEQDMLIINGRIVECRIGKHKLRDSYAILPVPLKAFGDKKEIDINKLHASRREKYMREIMDYMRQDCVGLYDAVLKFKERFGLSLTMAATAFKELEKRYGGRAKTIKRLTRDQDNLFRQFYFGGRVQVFQPGIIKRELKLHDVNSMYPFVMAQFDHPVGDTYIVGKEIEEKTDYALIRARSKGALPIRTKEGLRFVREPASREYFASGHEIRASLALGLLEIDAVVESYTFTERVSFRDFVEPIYKMRVEAKNRGDKIDTLFLKLLLNSSYGKMAIDPRRFCEYVIVPCNEELPAEYEPIALTKDYIIAARSLETYDRKKVDRKFLNVATAASITAAARAHLLTALESAHRPIYCDTDSIIAENLAVNDDDIKLGAWKIEARADEAAIAARKIYALFDHGACVKSASKGARLTPEEIRIVASGGSVTWSAPVPKISLTGTQNYVRRTLKAVA